MWLNVCQQGRVTNFDIYAFGQIKGVVVLKNLPVDKLEFVVGVRKGRKFRLLGVRLGVSCRSRKNLLELS